MTALRDQLQRTLSDQYVLDREIGRGGMATVFLARDTRHQRHVALKVLDPELGAVLGGERFLSEIRVTANLQHPNLLPLFDSGQADGLLFYVMPYVEGESLRARLDREKQLPIEDAVRIATAIANALDYAHSHGVIHRDLKPENILLQHGQPVVADFGIALAVSNAGGTRVTQTGLSLGTPQYMSPEQATGDRVIDGRTDIYSLAAMTYEMLTGEPPHTGTSAQAIIAKLMTTQPQPVRLLRPSVPANVGMAVERGLAKLPADRFGTARAFADALANATFTTGVAPAASTALAPRSARMTVALGALSAILMVAALWGWLRPAEPKAVLRYELGLDSVAALITAGRYGRIALSPDGTMLAYIGGPTNGIMLRRRDQLESRLIPGTNQSGAPAFSPDGKRIAFIQNANFLMIVSLDGSPPITVTDSLFGLAGLSWANNDTLYVDGRANSALVRVAARPGARPEHVAPLDSSMGEVDQTYPEVLPGGAVLYTMGRVGSQLNAIAVLNPRSGSRRILVEGARRPRYADGQLLYVTLDGTLMAVPFDPGRQAVQGAAVVVGTGLPSALIAVDVTVSGNGSLAFIASPNDAIERELTWVSRNGVAEVLDSTWRAAFTDPAISPDGMRLAVSDGGVIGSLDNSDIWIKPLGSGGRFRLSVEGGHNRLPTWTRDGKHVLYVAIGGTNAIVENPADGSIAATRRVDSRDQINVITTTPDAEWVVYGRGVGRDSRLYAHRRGDSASTRVIAEESTQISPALSPDGRLLAYSILDGRRSSVFVSPFPNTGNVKWLVSPDIAADPVWSNSGKELFYRDPSASTIVAVPVSTGNAFSLGAPKVLFTGGRYMNRFAVSRDDSRFLMIRQAGAATSRDRLTMVENWVEGLSNTNRP